MSHGYIALHRKLLNSAVFADAELLKVWVWCLMKATYRDREVVHAKQIVHLKRGEFITGRLVAKKELRMSENKYRQRIALLEKLGQICVKTTNKFSIISIVKYDYYQSDQIETTNKPPTNHQQTTTNNKDNNHNNNLQESMPWNKHSDEDFEDDVQIDPDYQPRGKTKKKSVAPELAAVFELFDNPAKAVWPMRPMERAAAEALLEAYGLEVLTRRMKRIRLEREKKDPYFPDVFSPSDLLEKMPRIEKHLGV